MNVICAVIDWTIDFNSDFRDLLLGFPNVPKLVLGAFKDFPNDKADGNVLNLFNFLLRLCVLLLERLAKPVTQIDVTCQEVIRSNRLHSWKLGGKTP